MQHRGSSDSRATADSHCAAQGSRNEMEMSRQRSSRDVLLIWLVKLQERVKRVDAFVRDTPPVTERRSGVIGKIAELGLVGLVHYSLAQFEEFTSGKRFCKEVREVLVSLDIRHDYLVVFHHLADKKWRRCTCFSFEWCSGLYAVLLSLIHI